MGVALDVVQLAYSDTQKLYETEWVHVFTVKTGKISRWRGFFNTAARYDLRLSRARHLPFVERRG